MHNFLSHQNIKSYRLINEAKAQLAEEDPFLSRILGKEITDAESLFISRLFREHSGEIEKFFLAMCERFAGVIGDADLENLYRIYNQGAVTTVRQYLNMRLHVDGVALNEQTFQANITGYTYDFFRMIELLTQERVEVFNAAMMGSINYRFSPTKVSQWLHEYGEHFSIGGIMRTIFSYRVNPEQTLKLFAEIQANYLGQLASFSILEILHKHGPKDVPAAIQDLEILCDFKEKYSNQLSDIELLMLVLEEKTTVDDIEEQIAGRESSYRKNQISSIQNELTKLVNLQYGFDENEQRYVTASSASDSSELLTDMSGKDFRYQAQRLAKNIGIPAEQLAIEINPEHFLGFNSPNLSQHYVRVELIDAIIAKRELQPGELYLADLIRIYGLKPRRMTLNKMAQSGAIDVRRGESDSYIVKFAEIKPLLKAYRQQLQFEKIVAQKGYISLTEFLQKRHKDGPVVFDTLWGAYRNWKKKYGIDQELKEDQTLPLFTTSYFEYKGKQHGDVFIHEASALEVFPSIPENHIAWPDALDLLISEEDLLNQCLNEPDIRDYLQSTLKRHAKAELIDFEVQMLGSRKYSDRRKLRAWLLNECLLPEGYRHFVRYGLVVDLCQKLFPEEKDWKTLYTKIAKNAEFIRFGRSEVIAYNPSEVNAILLDFVPDIAQELLFKTQV